MPAFSFEKISPPAPGDPIPPVVSISPIVVRKPRGVIVQIMDRFVEARLRLTLREPADADGDEPADRG